MIFSSLTFVVFFAIVLALFLTLRTDRAKHRMLLVASYVFYGWWDWRFCFLMAASSVWSWWFGDLIARATDPGRRRRLLVTAMVGDLGALAFFKYANFFLDSFVAAFGLEHPGALGIILPAGISFYTFHSMSYTIDLYRGRSEPCRSLEKYLLFVAFFPLLVAGPILRASHFLPQLDRPAVTTRRDMRVGAQLFVLGLFQKIVVADNVAQLVDPVFAHPGAYDSATLWLAMAAYTLQIFCDFAGYSLMAIGVARVLGYELCENFRMPYLARSITDFWRRWHISLSTWLRDYLYISLGGNRKGALRTDVNLFLTMLLGGLWHGAGWNFVLWGAAHGVGLLVHKRWARWAGTDSGQPTSALYGFGAWALTLLFVMLLWVPFRCASFGQTWTFLHGLVVDGGGIRWIHTPTVLLLALMAGWHLLVEVRSRVLRVLPAERPLEWGPMWSLALLLLAVLMFASHEAAPFIYFQF